MGTIYWFQLAPIIGAHGHQIFIPGSGVEPIFGSNWNQLLVPMGTNNSLQLGYNQLLVPVWKFFLTVYMYVYKEMAATVSLPM